MASGLTTSLRRKFFVDLSRERPRVISMRRCVVAAAAVLLLGLGAVPPVAQADFGIVGFTGGMFNEDGSSSLQAASHPYKVTTDFKLTSLGFVDGSLQPDGQMKDLKVDLPPGFIGNPAITPTKCTTSKLYNGTISSFDCPNSSQVGFVTTYFPGFLPNTTFPAAMSPLYNMSAPPDLPAQFAFQILGVPVYLNPVLRTGGDYGLSAEAHDISQVLAPVGAKVDLWGVPADPRHDPERICPGVSIFDPAALGCTTAAEPKAFITTPANCNDSPLITALHVNSWTAPADVKNASYDHDTNGAPIAVTGCDRVPFEPRVSVRPTTAKADSPTGLEVELTMPTEGLENPDGLAQASLRRVEMRLPEGMTVSPSAAEGLEACSPAQVRLGDASDPTCSDKSSIGSVEIDSPLLERPLTGSVYVASQGDNPFRTLLAMYVVARGPGVIVKLSGRVDLDPVSGRVTATFDDAPQLPFRSLKIRLDGGPSAPLAMPQSCGEKQVELALTSWSSPTPVNLSSTFSIDCPGGAGFQPTFLAGLVNPLAGSSSPFMLRLERPDGQEFIDQLNAELAPGLLAKVKGVPLCSDGDAGAGTCPADSQIGTVTVGAGPGANPFFLKGRIALTEGYRGAPYGLSIAVRAVAGPFDLGTVVVRQALFVDRHDAHVQVISDPLPTILQGIPLRLRTVQVDVDRPGFMKAPTSCSTKQVRASFHSVQGSVAQGASRLQLIGCAGLGFSPKMAMHLTGRKQTKVGKHPGLNVELTQPTGQTNIKQASVRLPLSLALDPDNARALCEYEAGLKVECPASSIIGRARAVSPLLNKPLTGPVYFVKGVRFGKGGRRIRTLPTLLIPLKGEIAIDLRATSDVKDEKLVTTFADLPDAPLSGFRLSLKGGRGGILTVTNHSLCRGDQIAEAELNGQSGKRADSLRKMKTPCSTAKRARR